MAQNSSESKENSTIESSINSQSQSNPPVAVTNALTGANQAAPTMKQESNPTSDMLSLESTPNPPEKQNGATNTSADVIDLTRPVKTEGEPSASSLTSAPMADTNTSGNHSLSSKDGLASTPTSVESVGMAAFGTQMAGLGAQLKLTAEEQAAAYKKANVLALTALAKKGGPTAREMLAVQQKLQEFLTSLIALAGQKGPELKVKVQLLVQNLVTGQISEEDFAGRIEADLHSQHQPSLLPFLKNSVPHLKTRLQLQQAIMKELLHRQAAEKQQQQQQQQQQKDTASVAPQQLHQAKPLTVSNKVTALPLSSTTTVPTPSPSPALIQTGQSGGSTVVAKPLSTVTASALAPAPTAVKLQVTKGGGGGSVALAAGSSSSTTATPGATPNAKNPIIIPPTSSTSSAIVVGAVGGGVAGSQIPPSIQQQLTAVFNSPAFKQQIINHFPKDVRDQVAKLPLEQQKFIYTHHLRQLQHLKQQAQQQNSSTAAGTSKNQTSSNKTASSSSGSGVPMFPPNSAAATVVATPQVVLEKQKQLIKQQQGGGPFVIGAGAGSKGGGAAASFVIGKSGLGGALQLTGASSSSSAAGKVGGLSSAASIGTGKTSFANLKLGGAAAVGQGVTAGETIGTAGSSGGPGALSNASPRKKDRSKGSRHKDGTAGDDEEDEVVGMDILDEVGVNLQEETAHFLPSSVGETTQRIYKDEVFLNNPLLRQRVTTIMRRYGLTDVSDEFLVLLSHATQERMKGVVEKLTQISQHRLNVLKDSDKYTVSSETRSQLRVLETIDRVVSKRKQERENEQTLRAAKSRSKGTDPEKVAKIREEAKQIQQDKAAQLLNAAANQTALAAIGQRKRPLSDVGGASGSSQSGGSSDGSSSAASLFASLTTTRAPKRHITSRDLIFYMEQERETRKSLTLYRTLLK